MKQKIVIRVCSTVCCDKCRSKALAAAAAACGVDSVSIEGEYGEQLVVVGECVDSAKLTCALRKKLGRAMLLHVSEIKKDNKKPPAAQAPLAAQPNNPPAPPAPPNNPPAAPPNPQPSFTFVCHYHHYHRLGYVCPWCGHGYYY